MTCFRGSTLLALLAVVLLGGCAPVAGGEEPPQASALGPCIAPDSLPEDPLTSAFELDLRDVAEVDSIHLLDIEVAAGGDLAFATGRGGVFVLALSDDQVQLLGHVVGQTMDSLEILPEDRLVIGGSMGFRLVDVSDPTSPLFGQAQGLPGVSGLAWDGEQLWLSTLYGEIRAVDLGPSEMSPLGLLEGLGSLWDLVLDGEGLGYAAGSGTGVHVLDLTDPSAPVQLGTVPASGSIQDLALADGLLLAALGAGGIEIFSLEDPESPASLAVVETGSSVVGVDAAGGVLWAADIDGVIALDISSPASPTVLGFEPTEQWAMDVVALDHAAVAAAWSLAEGFRVDPSLSAPQLDPNPGELTVSELGGSASLDLTNRGSSELVLSGAGLDDPRLSLSLETTLSLAPGEHTNIEVTYEDPDGGGELEATICLATNDPDLPLLELPVSTGGSGQTSIAVGEPAVDFVLPDLDGTLHQLSAQLGSPVVLVYFATW